MINAITFIKYYLMGRRRGGRTDREAFDRIRERRVVRHVENVRRRSAFYRDWWGPIPAEQWRTFPSIDKTIMMEHFDRLNTLGITRTQAFAVSDAAENSRNFKPAIGDVTVGLSSGTSGNRGLFLVGGRERAGWAGAMLGKMLPVSLFSRASIAFFLRANSILYESVRSRRLSFAFYDLLDPMADHLERLGRQQPDVIAAPPSVLRLIAEALRSGTLDVRPLRIISVAEVLDPLDLEYIGDSFGQAVHQIYQCTEGFLGCTCSHGTLHLNEDLVYIEKEYVPGKSRTFVPIVTDFSRTTQPIVRYRLNDLLTESEQICPCGSPFTAIERIEGRCDDIFFAPGKVSESQQVSVYPDFITRAIIGASSDIHQYRAVQMALDKWRIELELPEDRHASVEARVRHAIAELCTRLGCRIPKLEFAPYSHATGAVKLRRVERRFQP
ncbi:F390 synthetase-related protein [Cohnella terricola]|uniref:Adenylate cyclase n=1 Tax=Cohnella terricola TaxID=1289167 RepID=A0A559JQ84_9BACL|nr:F390 synthetase-related protein [Cohnella terricola]TVY02030.1 adenylate cyclase [Cohnella terricola]